MAPRRKDKHKLPVPLPEGSVLEDREGNKWALGKMIGSGGFGLIYLAFPTNKPNKDARHVIKVEYQENGPLFSELKFYQRAAKREYIQKWIQQRKLDYLGVPLFYGFGLTDFKGRSYRFMVMERLGTDLQKLSDRNGTFKKSTVLQLGIRMLDVLEYIHENEYVHGDIKAANLLLGYTNPDQVYLADYGLSYRYCPNGNHKQYQENPKKGHNGTIEFTSLDAHKGVGELTQFLVCVRNLAYDEKPDYQKLKKILNPDGVPLGSLEFSTKVQTVDVRTPMRPKVGSPKVTAKPGNDLPDKVTKKVCRETSATWGKEHEEAQPRALLSPAAAPENSRRRKINSDLLSEMHSLHQTPSYMGFQTSFCTPYPECTSRDPIRKPRSPPQYRYTPSSDVDVTDLESPPRLWPAVFQLTLSEEAKEEVYYHGITIFCLLVLVGLALYFL